jgi:hypothetical protein
MKVIDQIMTSMLHGRCWQLATFVAAIGFGCQRGVDARESLPTWHRETQPVHTSHTVDAKMKAEAYVQSQGWDWGEAVELDRLPERGYVYLVRFERGPKLVRVDLHKPQPASLQE